MSKTSYQLEEKAPHCDNGPEWRNGGANWLSQEDYLFSKHSNKCSLRCRRDRGMEDRVAKKSEEEGEETELNPDKEARFQYKALLNFLNP